MILPPYHYRRAWLRAFWIAVCSFVAVIPAAALSILFAPAWIAIVPVLLLPGLVRPSLVTWPYRAWNRTARDFSRFASRYVTGLYYYVVLWPLSRLGSTLQLRAQRESGWLRPDDRRRGVRTGQHLTGASGLEGATPFVQWASHSNKMWAISLLPFLLLLQLVRGEEQVDDVPTDTYTLY